MKICRICNQKFYVPPSYKTARFCSHKCRGIWFTGKNNPSWDGGNIKIICIICNKNFFVHPCRKKQAKFCSRKCHGIWMSKNLKSENNPSWKGNEVGYFAQHTRINNKFGRLKKCESCGENNPDKRYEWANLSGKYNYDDIADWMRLCRRCHKSYDTSGQMPSIIFK